MKKLLTLGLILIAIISCNSPETKQPDTAPPQPAITPEMIVENGDITLNIDSIDNSNKEYSRYKILSIYKGKPVGFWLKFKRAGKKEHFVSDGATFITMGDTSNNFLRSLADIYGLVHNGPVFIDSATVTYTNLQAMVDTSKPGTWIAAQSKLFFSTDDDNPELFLNIDEASKTISLPEKDPEYRKGIIDALSKKK
jgi:hypothetical protein